MSQLTSADSEISVTNVINVILTASALSFKRENIGSERCYRDVSGGVIKFNDRGSVTAPPPHLPAHVGPISGPGLLPVSGPLGLLVTELCNPLL